jgi:hypothetical protein
MRHGGLGSSRQGDPDAALPDLGCALHAGVPVGYCRLFLDEGPAMARRLQAAARRPDLPGSEQAGALLQAAKRRRTAPSQIFPPAPVGQEPLSEREVQVLRLLATTLTGPEIADQLFMSVHTFRTHTRHISPSSTATRDGPQLVEPASWACSDQTLETNHDDTITKGVTSSCDVASPLRLLASVTSPGARPGTRDQEPVMTITATGLTKAAGAAAAVAGSIFIAVQIKHPATDAFTTETTQWVARSIAKIVMVALALVGITGMYLRQHRKAGILGLVGYLVFAAGYLGLFCMEVIAAAVLPNLIHTEPGFVNDAVAAANGGTHGDIGGLQTLFDLAGAGYVLGGLIFGIALFRSRVLARWAAALLAVSTVATAALAVLPESFNRPLAVPEGIALIALGVSLWRNPRDSHQTPADSASALSPAAQLSIR